MNWSDGKITKDYVLDFGKWTGYTIREVLQEDPSYIVWLEDEGVLSIPSGIYNEALDNIPDETSDPIRWYGMW